MTESKLLRLTPDLVVNPAFVASVHWDRRHSTFLVITMQDGTEHSIKHTGGYYDTVDCYEVERKLLAA